MKLFQGVRVDVYRNLHQRCMSVRSRETDNYGRVIDHSKSLRMMNCSFVVQPAGRQKVLWSKKKNVHAFVRGELLYSLGLVSDFGYELDGWTEVTYNPYITGAFVTRDTEDEVLTAREVLVVNNKVYAKGLNLGV